MGTAIASWLPGTLVLLFGLGGGAFVGSRMKRLRTRGEFSGHLITDVPPATGRDSRFVRLALGTGDFSREYSGVSSRSPEQLRSIFRERLLPESSYGSVSRFVPGLHGQVVGNRVMVRLFQEHTDHLPAQGSMSRVVGPTFVGTIESSGVGSSLTGTIGVSYTRIGTYALMLAVGYVLAFSGLVVAVAGLATGVDGFLAALVFPVGVGGFVVVVRSSLRQIMTDEPELRSVLDDIIAA